MKPEFGNPVTGSGYQLCVYDDKDSPGLPNTLVYAVDIPGGSTWRETRTGFLDLAPTTNLSLKVKLTAGAAGKGRLLFKAKGADLGLAPHNTGVFFSQTNDVHVVLVQKSIADKCFRMDFSRPWKKNLASGFRDKD